MRQFWTVLKFETGNYLKNKSFLIITILLMAVGIAGIGLTAVFLGDSISGKQEEIVSKETEEEKQAVGIADPDQILQNIVLSESMPSCQWIEADSKEQAEEMVSSGEVELAFVVTGDTTYECIMMNRSISGTVQSEFDSVMARNYRATILSAQNIEPQKMEELFATPMQVDMIIQGKDSVSNYWYTYVMVMILYMMIIFYGQMIAVSVTTEKSNRAIEILVTSTNSNSLIFGKILAGALAGIVQTALFLGSCIVSYRVFRERLGGKLDFLFHIPTGVWLTFALFGIMGYLLYACMYGMLGALVSKTEDISKSATLVTLLGVVSFLIAMTGMTTSDSMVVKIASFVPFTSTNSMLVRMTMGEVAGWEIAVSAVLLVVTCIGAGVLAAKIFRLGTLMYGNPMKFTSALKKIREQ